MEDRHYLSDPRPISDATMPTWDVDVMREGVELPILTLRIDNTILPPRKSKKKVVWKLPDSLDTLPKFGQHEKKRILEIFKERKKELKKSKRRASQSSSPPASGSGPVSHAQNGATMKPPFTEEKIPATTIDTAIHGNQSNNGIPNGLDKKHTGKKPSSATASSSPSPPPGLDALSLDTTVSASSDRQQNLQSQNGTQHPETSIAPPPGLHSMPRNSATRAVPSQEAMNHHQSSQSQSQSLQNGSQHSQHSMPSTTADPRPSLPRTHLPSLPPSGRCFVVPPSVVLGNIVTEAYYTLLQRGLVAELASYYALDAQKSLTVGGAYAACVSAVDRSLQLQSLAGNIKPHIKGIQQQPTLAGGVMVMITGVSVRPPQGFLLPFCHTLVLCPVMTTTTTTMQTGAVGYQIQNDNLVFLTGDDTSGDGVNPTAAR